MQKPKSEQLFINFDHVFTLLSVCKYCTCKITTCNLQCAHINIRTYLYKSISFNLYSSILDCAKMMHVGACVKESSTGRLDVSIGVCQALVCVSITCTLANCRAIEHLKKHSVHAASFSSLAPDIEDELNKNMLVKRPCIHLSGKIHFPPTWTCVNRK